MKKFLMRLIIEEAIRFEERSYRYYEAILERAVMKDSIGLLKKLLAGELSHRLRLEEIQSSGDLGFLQIPQDAELEHFDEVSKGWPQLEPLSSKEEIFEAALTKEKSAANFYGTMAKRSHIKTIRNLFGALAIEELRHIKWIEDEMTGK